MAQYARVKPVITVQFEKALRCAQLIPMLPNWLVRARGINFMILDRRYLPRCTRDICNDERPLPSEVEINRQAESNQEEADS